jgi:hypothetical protein
MSQYARYAKSSWAECAICGLDFPQTEMVRHYKYKVLVDLKCADELTASDFMESLRLPENERPNPTQQQVPDQGTVTQDYGFFFSSTHLDTGKLRMTAEPRVGQPPQ